MTTGFDARQVRTLRVEGFSHLAGGEVPYVELGSRKLGPRVCLVAGVHGCEYTSMLGLRRFLAGIDQGELQGQIVAVPIANLASFEARTPFVVPHDNLNLNRQFPGSREGSFTDRLAHALFETLIGPSDFVLDLHAGDQVEALEPFTLFNASRVEDQARGLARHYGLRYSVRLAPSDAPVAGTTSAAAAEIGIPAITAEAGGCGLVDEDSVRAHLDGLARVFVHLGMLGPPAPALPIPPPPRELSRFVWMRSPKGGWWQPAVSPGQQVAAGQSLGTVCSLLGQDEVEVVAPGAGVTLFITTSPSVAAGGLVVGLGCD
jgi:predicted deacylase